MANEEIDTFSQVSIEEKEKDIVYQWAEEQERARNATTQEEVERAKQYGLQDLIPVFEEDSHNW